MMQNGILQKKSALGATAALAMGTLLAASAMAAPVKGQRTPEAVPGEIVVKFKPRSGMSIADVAVLKTSAVSALTKALSRVNVTAFRSLQTDPSMATLRLGDAAQTAQAIAALKGESSVEVAEPNYIYRATAMEAGVPNDPQFSSLWGMKNLGQLDAGGQAGRQGADINVLPLWQMGHMGSKRVVVAIIDTGIKWDHEDIAPNLFTNSREIAGNGKDDDGNGFVDDIHGWNFVSKSADSNDDNDHGTHCAGTIGAKGDNGKGVVGVNWETSVMPVKFLSGEGSGTLADAVESIKYATLMRVDIMSNSWGGGGRSETMEAAIKEARDAGILFVAAAGNDTNNNDGTPSYPASYETENVISVAATDNQDRLASFSNFGNRTVHVAAPGVRVVSSVKDGTYKAFSGTSMACPHVSGIAALMKSIAPSMGFAEIKDRLIKGSDKVRSLRRKSVSNGRVNAYNAVMGIQPPSNEPDESAWRSRAQVVESAHPYAENADQTFTVKVDGAKNVRLVFEKVDTENGYDTVTLETPSGEVIETLSGRMENYTTDYVDGDTVIIKFKSDSSVQSWGFKVHKAEFIPVR